MTANQNSIINTWQATQIQIHNFHYDLDPIFSMSSSKVFPIVNNVGFEDRKGETTQLRPSGEYVPNPWEAISWHNYCLPSFSVSSSTSTDAC